MFKWGIYLKILILKNLIVRSSFTLIHVYLMCLENIFFLNIRMKKNLQAVLTSAGGYENKNSRFFQNALHGFYCGVLFMF